MRTGICTVQLQALSIEAEATVKQAIGLARRRGHAHVTPLHVASAMLASSAGLLRRACLHCHSHPLQCKALELCFNVALNRLPTSTPSPLFGPQYPNPCLSNALVAAFKRAQAHQRRGSMENQQQQQQQPILALKIELEQLIISILDDPSVSRVMREAGFSSTQVKNRVEKAVSLEECNNDRQYFYEKKWNLLPTNNTSIHKAHFQDSELESTKSPNLGPNASQSSPFRHFGLMSPLTKLFDNVPNEQDVTSVLQELSNRSQRRISSNTVIVGENLATAEAVVRGIMEHFEKGDVPKELRHVEFISLPLFSLRSLSKEEIEQKVLELRCIVKSCMGKRVIFYLGDLKWVSEFWSNYGEQRSYYSPVEQIIMEIKRVLFHGNNGESYGRFWVLGIATFQIYMRCKAGHPSLESLWSLHPLTVPVGSLSLSLNFESKECDFPTNSAMAFPLCLQLYKEDARKSAVITNNQQDDQWLSSTHKGVSFLEKPLNFSPPSTSSDFCHHFLGPKHEHSPKEYQFWASEEPEQNGVVSKPDLLSNPNSSPNSASSSEVEEDNSLDLQNHHLKEFNPQNMKLISEALLKTIPKFPKDKASEISAKILQCRSQKKKQSCSLLFMGSGQNQLESKEKTAREFAKLFFGSQTRLISIGLSSFKDGEFGKKRGRIEMGCSYLQKFAEAVNENPHRVFLMEDFEHIDYCSLKGLKEAIEKGRVRLEDGEICPLKDAIIIFNGERQIVKQELKNVEEEEEEEEEEENRGFVSLDLNIAIIEDGNGDRMRSIMECVDGKILFS